MITWVELETYYAVKWDEIEDQYCELYGYNRDELFTFGEKVSREDKQFWTFVMNKIHGHSGYIIT